MDAQLLAQARLVEVNAGQGGHLLGRVQNGPVTGAAAQVARQRLLRLGATDRLVFQHLVLVQAKQAHGKAGRAKAALAGVALVQRLLHRMRCAVRGGQVGGGPQCHAIDGVRHSDAAVDGAVADLIALQLPQHHGAGAAVAFVAAFLGGAVAEVFAQQLQQRAGGRDVL